MRLEKQQKAVGVFVRRSYIESALRELQAANFPMNQVSVIARNSEQEDEIGGVEVKEDTGNKADEGATVGAVTGGALGGLTGLLVGLGLLAIPGVGPVILAGAGATTIATTLAGSAIGAVAGGLSGALIGLGIPEERANAYSSLVEQGYYLVIINGTESEVLFAERVLRQGGVEEWGVYDVPASTSDRDKYAVGLFYKLQDLEKTLNELKEADYSMDKVSVIANNVSPYCDLAGVDVKKDNFDDSAFDIPRNRAEHYHYRLTLGDYLIIVGGNDGEIEAAKSILERNFIGDFAIYSPSVATAVS